MCFDGVNDDLDLLPLEELVKDRVLWTIHPSIGVKRHLGLCVSRIDPEARELLETVHVVRRVVDRLVRLVLRGIRAILLLSTIHFLRQFECIR